MTVRSMPRATTVGVAVVLAVGGLVLPAAAIPQAPVPQAPATPVVWRDCAADQLTDVPPAERFRFSCADYTVPLDHDRPGLGTINIALLRRAAGVPSARVGSIFVNPGGPGGPGTVLPLRAAGFLQASVLDRFDVVGFDPRGIGRSTAVRCFATQEDADALQRRGTLIPRTPEQIHQTSAARRDYARYCDRFAGPLLANMSTEAVARDLDLLRAGVGDEKLTYVGFSYGTFLGATYVNLFPQRARAIVLDGSVDPRLRASDGLAYDRQRTEGFEIALSAFLAECDRVGPLCAYSGGARAKYDASREYLKSRGPVTLPDGTFVDYERFVAATGSFLYQRAYLATFAELLQHLHLAIQPGQPRVAAEPRARLFATGVSPRTDTRPDTPYTGEDSYASVNCSDKPFTNRLSDVPGIADRWDRAMSTFGRYGAWADAATCPPWPAADRYSGPWNRKTANPVLVVGNYYDPATRYDFAKRMAAQLGNARLVSVDAFGHCVLGESTCVDRITADYLINLTAPAPGQVCAPDLPIFRAPVT
ncbi:alpha/beta hydrolase [Actinokineospora globicatena]|nr:alpha/beta hydrolase [Actinokineospora globicatena]